MSVGDAAPIVLATDVTLAGDVLRVVHDGLPVLTGPDATAGLADLRARYERFRRFLNTPPNGNRLVNSCLLYPAADEQTVGRFFLASGFGYAPIAGTALMAASVVALDLGRLPPAEGRTLVRLDTAAGPAEVQAEVVNGPVARATWLARAPRVLRQAETVRCSDGRHRRVSLVTSGLPYIVVTADELGVALEDLAGLGPAAAALSAAVGAAYPLSAFGLEQDYARYLVMVTAPAAGDVIRTVWVSDRGEVAHSAGGTGALAVVAAAGAGGVRTVSAPGGDFTCEIVGERAAVTAQTRISARHVFYPLADEVMAGPA